MNYQINTQALPDYPIPQPDHPEPLWPDFPIPQPERPEPGMPEPQPPLPPYDPIDPDDPVPQPVIEM